MNWPDVTELKEFYDSAIGQRCKQNLRRAVMSIWPEAKGETLIGLGYALPVLRPYLKNADVVGNVMPSGQGVIHWPSGGQPNRTMLSHENMLPFHSGTLNRIILLHALEHAPTPSTLLNELQRCLTPSGRILLLVPNRHSLWARANHTPFANGKPYNLIQLKKLLQRHGFSVIKSHEALFSPPTKWRSLLRFSRFIEKIGSQFFPHFGGILLLEVEKRNEAPVKGTPIKVFTEATSATPSLNRDSS